MGPWSARRKNTSSSGDAMVHRQRPPKNQGPGRPSRSPGHPEAGSRPQEVQREERASQAPRPALVSSRGEREGQPEGRAVARSQGRPGPHLTRRLPPAAAARGPEASTSQHHVSPRQQTGATTQPSAAAGRHPAPQNDRIRTNNNGDPRSAEAMRNKRDTSPVKNVRSNQGAVGSNPRSMGRGSGAQPGPVTARGGVPRPARPPAPGKLVPQHGKRPGQQCSNQEHSRSRDTPHVTSAASDRNASAVLSDDVTRSGQQMGIVPAARHKGQNRPSQSQSNNNTNTALNNPSKIQNPSRNGNTANDDQSRLSNNPSSRNDARHLLQGASRQIVQKAGNNNKMGRNINNEAHNSQRTNTPSDVIAAPDTNRHSSGSSDGDTNVRNNSSTNTRHKQKNKHSNRDDSKPRNVNSNTQASTSGLTEGGNLDSREATMEASSSSGQRHTPRPRDNPPTNTDNPATMPLQRTVDTNKKDKNKANKNMQGLRQKPKSHARDQQRQSQRSSSDQSSQSDRSESSDRNIGATNINGNSRNRSQGRSDTTTRQNETVTATNMMSNEIQTSNSPIEGLSEGGTGGSRQSGDTSTGGRRQQQGASTEPRERSSGRDMADRAQRSSGQRMGLNNGPVARNQRTRSPPGNNRDGRTTGRSQSQPHSANAPGNSAPTTTNNTQNSANNAISPQRRTEVNSGIRNNTTNSGTRITTANSAGPCRTTTVNNIGTRNVQAGSSRATAVQNIASSAARSRPVEQNRDTVQNSDARVSGQSRTNRVNNAAVNSSSSGGTSHQLQRQEQSGAVLDPSQLNIDIMDNSEEPPPYSTLDVHTTGASRGNRNNRRNNNPPTQALPDILNSHVHPPRQNETRNNRQATAGTARNTRRNPARPPVRRPPRGTTRLDSSSSWEGCTKWGCLQFLTIITTFRWILITLALLGVACVLTGIVLGALHMTIGSSFLTLSLMFIGLGVMLVIVVGVGWRCTPRGHEPCHLLFSLGDHVTPSAWNDLESAGRSRTNPRNQWVGGTIYDEFQYRRPPPSYNVSMQEYQQQLVLAQIRDSTGQGDTDHTPSSPPPTYKSHASTVRPGLHITFPELRGDDYPSSRPPTYRSTAGTLHRPRIDTSSTPQSTPGREDDTGLEAENETADGVNNRSSSAESQQEQILNEINSTHSRPDTPASSSPPGASASSPGAASCHTLQRQNQVVGYLDDVLDSSLMEMDNRGNNQGASGVQTIATLENSDERATNTDSEDNETTRPNVEGSNADSVSLDRRRNSVTTTATTSSECSSSSNSSSGVSESSGATSNEPTDGSVRNSTCSQSSRDSSHIVADTHL